MTDWVKVRAIFLLMSMVLVVACHIGCGSLNADKYHHKTTLSVSEPTRPKPSAVDSVSGPPALQAYDKALASAIENRWYELLDMRNLPGTTMPGKVAVQFNLYSDGRVSDVDVVERTVDRTLALFCEKAILDLAPFEKWSEEMRNVVQDDCRDIKFTFYYNSPNPEVQRKR